MARRGGGARSRAVVLRSKLGWALWKAGAMVRQVVVVVGPGMAGIDAGDEPCGCRTSGEAKLVVAVALEERGQLLHDLHDAVSVLDASGGPFGRRSRVGGERKRRHVRA